MSMEAAIFDMDGVLVDTEDIYYDFLRNHLRGMGVALGVEYEQFRIDYRGSTTFDLWEGIKKQYGLNASVRGELVPIARKAYLSHIENLPSLEPIAGVTALIGRLFDAGLKLAVASSSSRARIPLMLKRIGVYDYFPHFVSSDDVTRGKPAPDCYLLAAEKIQADPTRCVVFEDAIHGIAAAKAAGMKTVGFNGLKSSPREFCEGDINVMRFADVDIAALRRLFS